MQYVGVDTLQILGISKQTITTTHQYLRYATSKALDRDNIRFGGPGSIVEIDESLFVRVKHHRGKDLQRPQVWVFGLYDRETQRVLFEVVPIRDAFTLLNIIYKYCDPKTVRL